MLVDLLLLGSGIGSGNGTDSVGGIGVAGFPSRGCVGCGLLIIGGGTATRPGYFSISSVSCSRANDRAVFSFRIQSTPSMP